MVGLEALGAAAKAPPLRSSVRNGSLWKREEHELTERTPERSTFRPLALGITAGCKLLRQPLNGPRGGIGSLHLVEEAVDR